MSAESSPTKNGQTTAQDSGTAAAAIRETAPTQDAATVVAPSTEAASAQDAATVAAPGTEAASAQDAATVAASSTEAASAQDAATVVASSAEPASVRESAATDPLTASTKSDGATIPDTERTSTEVLELEAESVHPPPPIPRSLRPKAALGLTSPPIGVTAQLPAHAWPPQTIADLMTRKIITVGEQEPIGNLEDLMQKFRFRHLPVVEAGMKLVGLITRTDLLHAELGRMPDGMPAPKIDGDTLASVIMNRNVVFAQLDTPIATACRVMIEKKLTCLPVVLADHTLVGILTESDLVKLSLDLLEAKG
jgi:CBS domain-containing membrane protein